MPTVRSVLRETSQRLMSVSETPQFEAELLLTHVAGWNKAQLLMRLEEHFDAGTLEPLVKRRLAHEPSPYILGSWEFYSLEFIVRPPLLVPRPETEHLVEIALPCIADRVGRVLDLCTGTGCVALALARNSQPAVVWATDINETAIQVAAENAVRHDVDLKLAQGDLYDALPADASPFDVIVSNPPYVEEGEWEGLSSDIRDYEDPDALLAGADGLTCIRRIVEDAPSWLASGGLLALEIGESQRRSVSNLLTARGFESVTVTRDLAGHDRIVHGRWKRV